MRTAARTATIKLRFSTVADELRYPGTMSVLNLRRRRLRYVAAVVLMSVLTILAGRLEVLPARSSELPELTPKHVNPLRPLAARAQRV
jgi:hypothetical protein